MTSNPVETTLYAANSSGESTWSKPSPFRSTLRLNGSTTLKIWFEDRDGTGVRFSLDMATGIVSNRENWTPEIQMPGEMPTDPEPLSVWGIDSKDEGINIIMHVGSFDCLYVNGELTEIEDRPDVVALLAEITNVVVRDIWIAPENGH